MGLNTKNDLTTLYLQLDNCWRENKNKYLMAYLEMIARLLGLTIWVLQDIRCFAFSSPFVSFPIIHPSVD